MDPTAEKECAALAAIFQQIISDMKVSHCVCFLRVGLLVEPYIVQGEGAYRI